MFYFQSICCFLTISSPSHIVSVQSLSCVQLFVTIWTAAHQAPYPSPTPGACSNSCPSGQWCHSTISTSVALLLLSSVIPSIRVFSNESVLHIRWPKYWSFSFSISLSNEYSGLISFRIDWFDSLQSKQSYSATVFSSISFTVFSTAQAVFFCTTVQKHQFFSAQLSLLSSSHVHTWLQEKL